MTPADILLAAKPRLTPETWCQYGFGLDGVKHNVSEDESTMCLSEAIWFDIDAGHLAARAVARNTVERVVREQYPDLLPRLTSHPSYNPPMIYHLWNDYPTTTLADVWSVLDKAIAEVGG